MKIGFNAQRLAGQRLGVGRYIEYMVNYWAEMLRPSEHVTLYLRKPLSEDERKHLRLTDAMTPKLLRSNMSGIPWENLILARHLSDVDVLFSPAYTTPLAYRGRCVIGIHSVNEMTAGAHPWWVKRTYTPLYKMSGHKADAVIVPCESTKADVQRHYKIPAEKIEVIPQGADPSFRPLDDEALLRATRKRLLGEDSPYVLYVGKMSQRRNIPRLIEAFARVKKRRAVPHKLLLFGPNHVNLPLKQLIETLGVSDSVVQTDGRIANHKELIPIYNAADVFVHPSLYEGWSMTTVEALACGTAVIAANRGGLADVASGHALMVDDPTPEALSEALDEVLGNPDLRQELRLKARQRGEALLWEDTTRQTLDVIRRVAAA